MWAGGSACPHASHTLESGEWPSHALASGEGPSHALASGDRCRLLPATAGETLAW